MVFGAVPPCRVHRGRDSSESNFESGKRILYPTIAFGVYFFISAVINAVVVSVQAKRVAASHRGLRVGRVEGPNLIFAVASIMVFAFSLQRTPDPLATALGEAAPESALAPRPSAVVGTRRDSQRSSPGFTVGDPALWLSPSGA